MILVVVVTTVVHICFTTGTFNEFRPVKRAFLLQVPIIYCGYLERIGCKLGDCNLRMLFCLQEQSDRSQQLQRGARITEGATNQTETVRRGGCFCWVSCWDALHVSQGRDLSRIGFHPVNLTICRQAGDGADEPDSAATTHKSMTMQSRTWWRYMCPAGLPDPQRSASLPQPPRSSIAHGLCCFLDRKHGTPFGWN